MNTPDLGIVVPAHNERENLQTLARELGATLGPAGVRFELCIVDDGSGDDTPDVIRALAAKEPSVVGVRLSRNFGHQAAISVGLRMVRGGVVAIMDADLQDKPADLLRLYEHLRQTGADVVYASRRSRPENIFKRLAYRVFYRLFARVATIKIQLDSGDFCVMSRAFVERLNALPERLRFVRGLRAWLGGAQVGLAVDRDARRHGQPQYTLGKLVRLATDGLFSFSDRPLRIASALGVVAAALALFGIVAVFIWKATGRLPQGAGVATIALSVLFFGGVQLVTIGILGEYIARIFDEVKGRPVAVVSEVMGAEQLTMLTDHSPAAESEGANAVPLAETRS